MPFELPETIDIEQEIDGRRFEGAYSFMLGDMVVYYNGHTKSVRKPDADTQKVALDMLRQLVQENYVGMGSIPRDLPQRMREAALEYVNSFDDEEPIRALVESFGEASVGSHTHTQLSWLCVNAVQPIVPFWKFMCDDDTPERTLDDLAQWLCNRAHSVDWESARQPAVARRDGLKIVDCDACRAEPIAKAVAHCANYLQNGQIESAVETIFEAWGAHSEGCWPEDEQRPYERWLVEFALPNAFQCKPASRSL